MYVLDVELDNVLLVYLFFTEFIFIWVVGIKKDVRYVYINIFFYLYIRIFLDIFKYIFINTYVYIFFLF